MTTETRPPPQRIAVVGAGPAGLSLALFLQRALPTTTQLTILEARERSAADGGYLALAPNALHVLDQLNLYERLLPQGCAYEEIRLYSARNFGVIGTVLNGSREKYGYPALRISRHTVRQTLLEEVLGKGLQIRFGTKVMKVEETGNVVKLNLGEAGVEEFDVVIGADGIHSRVRQLISGKEPTFSGQVGVGGGGLQRDVVGEDLHLPCMLLGKTNGFMIMPTTADGQSLSCFATVEMEPRSREGWAAMGEDKEGLKRVLVDGHCGPDTEWPEIVKKVCREGKAETLTVWPHFHAPALETWMTSSSRVILMGDAAHAMPPTGGQGAAQAFEDAASLACVFAQSADGDAFGRNVKSWQEVRLERCRKIKAFTAKGGEMRRSTPSAFQQIVKEWAMWLWMLCNDGGFSWVYAHQEQGPKVKKV